jgi:hypothetical protein
MSTHRQDPQALLDALQAHMPRLRQDLARFFPAAADYGRAAQDAPRPPAGPDRAPADDDAG